MPNRPDRPFDRLTIALHWLVAVLVVFLFALGVYMVGLTYYDPWYRPAPALHKGVGVLAFMLILIRLAWRFKSGTRPPGARLGDWEVRLALTAHLALYVLLILVPVSGYFISTADGRALDVFTWFSIPALVSSVDNLEEIAGVIHRWLAYGLMGIAIVHTAAALKHHFIAKDDTLRNMLGLGTRSQS